MEHNNSALIVCEPCLNKEMAHVDKLMMGEDEGEGEELTTG